MDPGNNFKIYFLLLFFSLSSFSYERSPSILKKDYETVKTEVNRERKKFKALYDSAKTESTRKKILADAGRYLLKSLTDTIFPYWYGTTWDFNGYSDKPGEGKLLADILYPLLLSIADLTSTAMSLRSSIPFP